MKIIGVNGILTHGEANVDLMLEALENEGFPTLDLPLPKVGPLRARWQAKQDAKAIMEVAEPDDILLAHSFGCLRSYHALKEGLKVRHVYMFRPAMGRGVEFAPYWPVTCFYSKDDHTVRAGSYLIAHPFGQAGVKGFKSPHVRNVRSTGSHNADFYPPLLNHWVQWIADDLRNMHDYSRLPF
jgi:hypothetical protein